MSDDIILKREMEIFNANSYKYLPEHEGEWILIYREEIVGFYKDIEEGLRYAYEKFNGDPFLLKPIEEDEKPVHFFHGVL